MPTKKLQILGTLSKGSGVYVGSGEIPEGYNVQIDTGGAEVFVLPEVLQEAGDSEVDTMSQKAITEYVDQLINGILGGAS